MLHGPCGSRNGPDEVFGKAQAFRMGIEANSCESHRMNYNFTILPVFAAS